jgi:hypothetical protein
MTGTHPQQRDEDVNHRPAHRACLAPAEEVATLDGIALQDPRRDAGSAEGGPHVVGRFADVAQCRPWRWRAGALCRIGIRAVMTKGLQWIGIF